MQFIRLLAKNIVQKPSAWLFVFLIIFSFDRYSRWVDYDKGSPFVHDVYQYYGYLPATFVYHDLSFNYQWAPAFPLPNGNRIPKVTMGMSLLYSPFFLIAHAYAKLSDYPADGFSAPYKWIIHIGTFIYVFIGLWYCRKILLLFFSEWVTTVTLLCIFLGTNLFYYTFAFGEMSHSYLFSLQAIFIFYSILWVRQKKLKHLVLISFLGGFCCLIRPTEALIFLLPLLFEVRNFTQLKERLQSLLNYGYKIIYPLILLVLPFFLQMIYWRIYADQWLYFSYGSDERFFFNDPQIVNFLFGFRKGWFIYSPMMIFSIIGFIFLKKYVRGYLLFVLIFLVLDIYILSSWWAWSYGGAFGCRALIQHYTFLLIPFASFTAFVFDLFKGKIALSIVAKSSLLMIFFLLIRFNFWQSWLYKYGIISDDSMTKAAYFYILDHDKMTPAELQELGKLKKEIPVSEMKKGNRDE